MQFNASENDQITVGPNSAFYNTTSGAVSFWMRSAGTVTTSGTEGAVLFDMRSSRGLSILQTDDGHVRVYAYSQNNSTPVNTITSNATVSDNQWHLITVDFTQGSGSACSLYIDGVLDNQGNNTAAWNWTQTQPIALGQSMSAYTKNWRKYNGLLDDVRFYNATLTAAQITSIYKGADEAVVSSDVNLNVQSQMYNVNASTFIRIPFNVTDPNAFTSLLLTVRNNDGFVAWINGVQVASRKRPHVAGLEFGSHGRTFPGPEPDRHDYGHIRHAPRGHEYPRHPGIEQFRIRSQFSHHPATRRYHRGRHYANVFRHAHSRGGEQRGQDRPRPLHNRCDQQRLAPGGRIFQSAADDYRSCLAKSAPGRFRPTRLADHVQFRNAGDHVRRRPIGRARRRGCGRPDLHRARFPPRRSPPDKCCVGG